MKIAIVGGGPAGLATAIAGRMKGLDVVVLDQGTPPLDKACGEGLMPAGVEALAALGVDNPPGYPFRGIRYVDSSDGGVPLVADGAFPEGQGLGIRRIQLHPLLVHRAESLGAELRWGTRVTGLVPEGLSIEQGLIEADWVVGADGLHSVVRRWAGAEIQTPGPSRFGVRRHFAIAPWSPWVEVHWASGCEAYVTPVGPQEVGIALLWSDRKAHFKDLLSHFPELERRLAGASPSTAARGAGPFHQVVKPIIGNKVALVGDASGYYDAITGEGLALSFRQAMALAQALADGIPEQYQHDHRKIQRPYVAMTRVVLLATRRSWLRRRIIRALSREPTVFSNLLGAVEGQVSRIGWGGLARLLLRVLLGR